MQLTAIPDGALPLAWSYRWPATVRLDALKFLKGSFGAILPNCNCSSQFLSSSFPSGLIARRLNVRPCSIPPHAALLLHSSHHRRLTMKGIRSDGAGWGNTNECMIVKAGCFASRHMTKFVSNIVFGAAEGCAIRRVLLSFHSACAELASATPFACARLAGMQDNLTSLCHALWPGCGLLFW